MKRISDGWHNIAGYEIYVEKGRVLRGLKKDRNGQKVCAFPYRHTPQYGGWTNCSGLSVDAFRAGVNRGTIMMS